MAIASAWLATSLLTGCVHYQAKPLTPAGTLSTIEQRTIDDPQLKTFLEANHIGSGADMLRPLAITVIRALSVSVLLSLVATPTVYYAMRVVRRQEPAV